MDDPSSPPTVVRTSDLAHASWLAASGLTFLEADASTPGRTVFTFADPERQAAAMIGALELDPRLSGFTLWRNRFSAVIRSLRDSRKTKMTGPELDLLRGRR
jgi:hypothetical protein